jgi:hypothetical protein
MENAPTGHGSDLPTILRFSKAESKFKSVNNSFQGSDLGPTCINKLFYQPQLRTVFVVLVICS